MLRSRRKSQGKLFGAILVRAQFVRRSISAACSVFVLSSRAILALVLRNLRGFHAELADIALDGLCAAVLRKSLIVGLQTLHSSFCDRQYAAGLHRMSFVQLVLQTRLRLIWEFVA